MQTASLQTGATKPSDAHSRRTRSVGAIAWRLEGVGAYRTWRTKTAAGRLGTRLGDLSKGELHDCSSKAPGALGRLFPSVPTRARSGACVHSANRPPTVSPGPAQKR